MKFFIKHDSSVEIKFSISPDFLPYFVFLFYNGRAAQYVCVTFKISSCNWKKDIKIFGKIDFYCIFRPLFSKIWQNFLKRPFGVDFRALRAQKWSSPPLRKFWSSQSPPWELRRKVWRWSESGKINPGKHQGSNRGRWPA